MIYVVRHGKTTENGKGVLRGTAFDDELSEEGIEQAKQVAEQLKKINFELCFCSPLARARQTCEIIFDGKINYDKRLLPRDYGNFAGKRVADLGNFKDTWKRTDVSVNGEESVLAVERRLFEFLGEIKAKHPGKDILVVTHASILCFVRGLIDGFPKDDNYSNYQIAKNCEVLELKN